MGGMMETKARLSESTQTAISNTRYYH